MTAATLESGDIADVPAERATGPRAAWLARRERAWGASEVPVLLADRGLLPVTALPAYLRAELEPSKRHGVQRYLARKAGLLAPLRMGGSDPLDRLERDLLETWARVYADEHMVEGVMHASAVHRQLWPMRDRESDHLACSLDGWASDAIDGRLVVVQAKCPPVEDAWAIYGPRYEAQILAEMACPAATRGLCVIGERWVIPPHEGPILTHEIARDEGRIAQIRAACDDAWATVEDLRARRQR